VLGVGTGSGALFVVGRIDCVMVRKFLDLCAELVHLGGQHFGSTMGIPSRF